MQVQVYVPKHGKIGELPLGRKMPVPRPRFGPPHGPFYTSSLRRRTRTSDWLRKAESLDQPVGVQAALLTVDPEARVLTVDPDHARRRLRKYLQMDSAGDAVVSWARVAADYFGIHVTRTPNPDADDLLYGFDAESTAWFDTVPLRLLFVVPVVDRKLVFTQEEAATLRDLDHQRP